jgi:hypothetical protein
MIYMSAMKKTLVVASVLMAAALTGIFSAHPMAAYAGDNYDGESSETNTEQKIEQRNIGSDAAPTSPIEETILTALLPGTADISVLDDIMGGLQN